MTFGLNQVLAIHRLHSGKGGIDVLGYKKWPRWLQTLYIYVIGCHLAQLLEIIISLICWFFLFPKTFPEAKEWRFGWVYKVVLFNLACEFILYSFWHYMTYASAYAEGKLKEKKFNPVNQYEPSAKRAGFFSSPTGHLQREILFTTLGWLQSSAIQCIFMWLWANNKIPVYLNFWDHPVYSIFLFLGITYWREFHFYWVHRMEHPWWNIKYGLADGDIGAFMYRHFHSLHHKSYNPGPWSGLSMHPVEHFFYYSCTFFPLFLSCHPLHFLYTKFHADISPIGGHDGFADPGGNSDFHYLHHAKFECNYGTELVEFDRLFGSFVELNEPKKIG